MAATGYSGTPLVKKLGIREGYKVIFCRAPAHLDNLLGDMPEIQELPPSSQNAADFILLFCNTLEQLEAEFLRLKKALKPSGMLWVSWPKKASALPSDLDGNIVRRYGLSQGLVDVKVCAIDADWSGLKFMYRIKDRQALKE